MLWQCWPLVVGTVVKKPTLASDIQTIILVAINSEMNL